MVAKTGKSCPLKSVNPGHPAQSYPGLKYRARNAQKFVTEVLGGVRGGVTFGMKYYGFMDVI
jgi:hypothetical protein